MLQFVQGKSITPPYKTPLLPFMKPIQVYDPAMCCSTGVCGPEVDPDLVRFAADLKWLQDQGVEIRRFGLAQNPAAFVENRVVRDALTSTGEAALPIVLVGDMVVATGRYPAREELAARLELAPQTPPSLFTPAVAELVAIGAAVAANCEPCLRFHVNLAEKHGVSSADIANAVELAAKVKDAPHRSVLRLAAKLVQPKPAPDAEGSSACCSASEDATPAGSDRCCG
jgi:AhpD family alkylhydroperoxidase